MKFKWTRALAIGGGASLVSAHGVSLHSDRVLQAPLGLLAWQGPPDPKDLRAALDFQEFEANR